MRIIPTVAVLCALHTGLAAQGEEQKQGKKSFNEAASTMETRLTASLKELTELQEQIAKEKLPLTDQRRLRAVPGRPGRPRSADWPFASSSFWRSRHDTPSVIHDSASTPLR